MLGLPKFLSYSLIFALGAIILLLVFPLGQKTQGQVQDLTTFKIEQKEVFNPTAPILIVILGIVILIYALQENKDKSSKMRDIFGVMEDKTCQQKRANFKLGDPINPTHDQLLSDTSYGMLGFAIMKNDHNDTVPCVYVANDNYATTETKIRLTNPIIGISTEITSIYASLLMLPPKERRRIENQIDAVLGTLSQKDPEIAKLLLQSAEKRREELRGEEE